jgi:hypothetical protein
MEKKLQTLEQQNFGLKEKIASANNESDFESIKNNVLNMIRDYNKWLQKQMLNPNYNY